MKCHQAQKRLSAYQDGELKSREQEKVREHLESCLACRQRYAEMEKTWQALGNLQEISPEPGFYGQVVRKINESCGPRPLPRWQGIFQLFSSVAGCTLLIIGLLMGTFLGNYLAGSGFISPQFSKRTSWRWK